MNFLEKEIVDKLIDLKENHNIAGVKADILKLSKELRTVGMLYKTEPSFAGARFYFG